MGDQIAASKTMRTPCLCDRYESGACELLANHVHGDLIVQRIACRCGEKWKRVIVGGQPRDEGKAKPKA